MNTSAKVSIIIPTYNEQDNIAGLLQSVFEQTGIDEKGFCEVLVIDNGSADQTVEICRRFGVDVYIRPHDSIAGLRNYGALKSCGEILIFSDADNVFTPKVVRTVVDIFDKQNWDAAGPDGLRPVEPATGMQRLWYFHTRVFKELDQCLSVGNLSSGFLAIRRGAFDKAGGFDQRLDVGEDSDLSARLKKNGMKLLRTNRFSVYNTGQPVNVRAFLKREFWHGESIGDLLNNRGFDLFALYLVAHLLAVAVLIVSLITGLGFPATTAGAGLFLCLAPICKAFKKNGGFRKFFFLLFGLYFLYVCARSAALFKRIRPKRG